MTEKRQEFLERLRHEPAEKAFAAMHSSGEFRKKLGMAEIRFNKAQANYEEARKENEESKRRAKEAKNGEQSQIAFGVMEASRIYRDNLAKAEREYEEARKAYEIAKAENEKAKQEVRFM